MKNLVLLFALMVSALFSSCDRNIQEHMYEKNLIENTTNDLAKIAKIISNCSQNEDFNNQIWSSQKKS